jgi:hypothetical protein
MSINIARQRLAPVWSDKEVGWISLFGEGVVRTPITKEIKGSLAG